MTRATHLERFFRDPTHDVLGPGCAGIACANLRQALARLGFGGDAPDFSDRYDDSLAQAVFTLQTRFGHSSRDGLCGPGTRALLARVMNTDAHRTAFRRWPDPERRNEGHAFVSYAHDDMARVKPFIALMEEWGYRIWFDGNLTAGSRWSDALEQQVTSAWLVIVFVSHVSVQSQWVLREATAANAAHRRIMPVLIDPVPADHLLATSLSPHQYLSLQPVTADGMDDVIAQRLAQALCEAHGSQFQVSSSLK